MRAVVFRTLAGLLAIGFVATLLFADNAKLSVRELIGMSVVALGFGLYALLGTNIGERIIWLFCGGSDSVYGPQQPEERDENSSDDHEAR